MISGRRNHECLQYFERSTKQEVDVMGEVVLDERRMLLARAKVDATLSQKVEKRRDAWFVVRDGGMIWKQVEIGAERVSSGAVDDGG